jgi:ribosomal protein S18 acetylase RimI-like enzyme
MSNKSVPVTSRQVDTVFEWRGKFENAEVNSLHAAAFGHELLDVDWWSQVGRHSLGWIGARDDKRELVGFVNVSWDGGAHAFILDIMVANGLGHRGIGSELIAVAVRHSRASGCQWLHVDFEESLSSFYFGSCDFSPTSAGIIKLID